MDAFKSSFQSALGRVRGIGSAKSGTHHYWMQRVSAILMIVTSSLLVTSFTNWVVLGDYSSAFIWFHSPLYVPLIIVFLICSFYHGTLGVEVVLQDYIHNAALHFGLQMLVKFVAMVGAIMAILAVLRIFFSEHIPHV